jgi:hypothetical protein
VRTVYARATVAGSTPAVESAAAEVNQGDWTCIAATLLSGKLRAFGGAVSAAEQTVSGGTIWNNNNDVGIAKLPNGSEPFNGRLYFAASFAVGISESTFQSLRDGIERVLADVVTRKPAVIFEGNSLTGSATGGGTTWPAKLRLKTGWDSADLGWDNEATAGHKQIEEVEPQLPAIVAQWAPYAQEDRLLILMSGTNDVNAETETQLIIDSLNRYLIAAKAAGFRVVACTIPPVASAGGGYTWNPSQQAARDEINNWMKTTGATIADQVLDLDEIGDTYPEFLDPEDTTYYVDGLHHNDAGRALIADFVDANVAYPVYDEF